MPVNQLVTERIAYSAAPERPPLRWPGGARVALWVAPNIEHYEFLPEHIRVRDPWPRLPHPDILGYGLYNTRYHWNLSEADERAAIEECQHIHRQFTGRGLPGWFSPAASNTLNTPDLVAEAGIGYLCDLYHDDQPTPIQVRQGELYSLPYSMEINDSIAWRRGQEGAAFAQKICDEFDTLYAEGAVSGQVMNIAVHPFIMGQPHRIELLAHALDYVLSHSGVWCAAGSDIVASYREQTQPATQAGQKEPS